METSSISYLIGLEKSSLNFIHQIVNSYTSLHTQIDFGCSVKKFLSALFNTIVCKCKLPESTPEIDQTTVQGRYHVLQGTMTASQPLA